MKTTFLLVGLGLSALAAPQYETSPTINGITYPSPIACGDHTTNSIQCPVRQQCFHTPGVNPDHQGVCIGQPCGGFNPHPQYCPNGQICVRPVNDTASTANLPGHCVSNALVCTTKGGECQDGWSCVAKPKSECKLSDPDCQGVCEPNTWDAKSTPTEVAISTQTIAARQPSTTLKQEVTPTSVPNTTHPMPVFCMNSDACASQDEYCQLPHLAHGWNDPSPTKTIQCMGQRCRSFFPNEADCPQGQVCIKPINGKDATKDFPGRCAASMLSCLGGYVSGCLPKTETCVQNPEHQCELRKGNSKDDKCLGICSPNDWAEKTVRV